MTSPVSALTGPSAAASAPATAATTGDRSALDPQAFLQLLVAQLKYQDPSNPTDTSSFMAQTATLSQVQTMTAMSSTLTALVNAQQAQSATELIGRTVTYLDVDGEEQSGLVTSASLLSSGATVKVGDVDVLLSSVVGVSAAPSTPA